MTDTGKVSTGSLCAHLETCHLQLLLAAQGLPSDGTRSELETQLEKALQKRTAGTWVWEKLPEVVQPCFGGSMVEWNGGIYLFGGYGGDGQASNGLYTWYPGYGSWQQILPKDGGMVPPALYHHSAVVYKQEMWVLGSTSTGRIGERTSCFVAFNFKDNSWRRIEATGPTPLCITQCTTFDACVCGSSVILGSQDGIYALDMETLVWSILYKSPGVTMFWTNYHISVEGRDLYMFGWSDAHIVQEYSLYSDKNELHMYRFNLDTNVWTKITYSGDAPKPRDRFSSVRVQNKWVIHGGTGSMIHGKSLSETFIYNFSTRAWVELEHSRYQPYKRAHYSCAKFGKDRVIFCGGRLDWNGRNQSLSTPCYAVESLRLVDNKLAGNNQHQALMVINDTARSIVMKPVRCTLYANKHLSDVILVVDKTEIPAHKLVLAEGSSFFDRMWESGMVEGRSHRVEITGVSLEVMEIVLKYLYGCLDTIPSDDIVGVFYAADMYEVPGLQAECLNLMLGDMSYSSLIDYWHLGHTHGFEEMANGCVDFAADNPVGFLNSESFQLFKRSDPALAKHLLESVCTRLKHEFHENDKTEFKDPNQPMDGIAECALLENECKTNIDKLADEHAKLEKMVLELGAKLGN